MKKKSIFVVKMHLATQASLQTFRSEITETKYQIKHNRLKIPAGRRQTSRLYTSVAKNRARARGLQISSPAP